VKKKLLEIYGDKVPGNKLNVFCASNTIYWDHRTQPKDKAMPRLLLSGILGIREHCMAMVSANQYAAAERYIQNDVQALLGELKLWVQAGQGSLSAEKKEGIRNTLDAIERKVCQV
jgi:hypothetical protein